MNISDLEELKKIKYNKEHKNTYININNINIDSNIDIGKRIEKLIQEIDNPYIIKCNNTIVEIEYTETNNTIDDHIINYLKNIKNK